MDFYEIRERTPKRGCREVYPEFRVFNSKDLMVRGKSFYAMWNPSTELWTMDEYEVQRTIDNDLAAYRRKMIEDDGDAVSVKYAGVFSSSSWVNFKRYLQNLPDNYHQLDETLTFADTVVTKKDYVSRRLPYALKPGDHSAFDELLETLYDEEEREKILWCIGSIVAGDSKKIQKFAVLYGDPGSGKGTVLDIIRKLFADYCVAFKAKDLVSHSDNFATEIFRTNPLVCIDPDAILDRIEDNTTLNTIVSHEIMVMKEKYKPAYNGRANAFLFLGTNRPVKITDAKSGIIRRLIDISPSGRKIDEAHYWELMSKIDFELGAIASYCLAFYQERGRYFYNGYKPVNMMYKTDEFFNFVEDQYFEFKKEDGVSLTSAYDRYKAYCEESGVTFRLQRYKFREELKNYFRNFEDVARVDGRQIRSWYSGFIAEKFERKQPHSRKDISPPLPAWLKLDKTASLLDVMLEDCVAQYCNEKDVPKVSWSRVKTKLKDLDTSLVHCLLVPLELICVDFDLKNATGEKDRLLNLLAASKWPETYAEYSKGGNGLHLYYIWDGGDPNLLQSQFEPGIEIKVFKGKASLRRRVSFCNDIPVQHLSSGLPVKEGKKMLNFHAVQSEKGLRDLIERNLRKEIHPGTKPSIDFIDKILSDAYDSGLHYDVSDLRPRIMAFANHSSHQAAYCLTKVAGMKFKSEDCSEPVLEYKDERLIFFDVEVFPNLVLINWKPQGADKCVRMINPSSREVEQLMGFRLVGFNCRRYDNHILYAIYIGKTPLEVYDISQKIIGGSKNAMFSEAYNISYTDVYDFCSKKQSLKKWEIELGIHHQELGLPWDQPVPEELWMKVAEYCDNDVFATEAVFNDRQADWTARQILADIAGMTVNDTTNSLTTRIIFGANRHPQDAFNYRNMGEVTPGTKKIFCMADGSGVNPEFTMMDEAGRPVFPGYSFDHGKSMYRGEDVGLGGYVYAEPGIHYNVALLDIASMHPSSTIAENLFGEYTQRYKDILDARILIKHKEYDKAKQLFDGKLAGYLEDESQAKALSQALKIAINSVYGLTSASFDNPFRDIRNVDNIVAKRGALFMVNLKHEVQARGYTVAHIKTDSIKIPDADDKIIQFVMAYGKLYGYSFEYEATYERMCLVNDAVYIAKYSQDERNEHPGEWTATGTQFQVPYVFKTLFSHEPILFSDLCETKTVTTALYLDMNEDLPDVTALEGERAKLAKQEPTEDIMVRIAELDAEIAKGHNYIFVGKAGLFCPVQRGCGGGWLTREKTGKYYSATGAKGYRWKEAEVVKSLGLEHQIDKRYFDELVKEARKAIEVYDDFDVFIHGDPAAPKAHLVDIPPWCDIKVGETLPAGCDMCGGQQFADCTECPHWVRAEDSDGVDEVYYCNQLEEERK